MGVILGIDIGGSTTKIAGYYASGERIAMLQVQASDPLTSLYGAIGNFLNTNEISLGSVVRVVITGVGAALVRGDIYGIPTVRVSEFDAIGVGGLALSNKREALVVSMGTGTAFVRAGQGGNVHIGGSGVGGGTLLGLSWHLFHENDFAVLSGLAADGNLENVDLTISDISQSDISMLSSHATASNFGKMRGQVSTPDLALGLINMVFQTIGMMSVFALRNDPVRDVVLIGSLVKLPLAHEVLRSVEEISNVRFFIPENAVFATAIGAALPFIENGGSSKA